MRNIASLSIERPLYPTLLILACLLGGAYGIETVGRLEDPAYPFHYVLIVTEYPGASAAEVEQEVTDVVEAAVRELPHIEEIVSKSVAGRSEVQVEFKDEYDAQEAEQIFDELRRRVGDAVGELPPGAGQPLVNDDFGDVFGILYAVSAPSYDTAEIQDMARGIVTALKSVEGVAKVQTAGEPQEAVYVEVDHLRLGRLGLPMDILFSGIGAENDITPAGSILFDGRRLRIAPQAAFDSAAAVRDMRIGRPGSTEIVRLADIANLAREPIEEPPEIIRHNGERAFTVGVSIITDENVVEVGRAVDARMDAVLAELPLGVAVETIYAQHDVVEKSIREFLRNLGLSIATVVLALCLFMGWRAGTVVGAVLFLTILGTICLMSVFGIELHRITLGAMMIAMGMLVDNGIVIAEGMVVGVGKGLSPTEAAAQSVHRTQFTLLGATVIGIAAFGPIGLSDDVSGQFLHSMFQVVGISLLLSWLLAVTVVPLLGSRLLKAIPGRSEEALFSGWAYAPYRRLVSFGLRRAWLTTVCILGVLAACLWGFQFVKQAFFPTTNSPLFFVEYRLAEGTDILTTAEDTRELEATLRAREGVTATTAFIGKGAPRFTAIMNQEQPNAAYAQLVVRVADVRTMDDIMASSREALAQLHPGADIQVTRAEFTPSGNAKIEARFSGPEAGVLRALAGQALDIFMEHDLVDRHVDWRQPALEIRPRYDEARARLAGVSRRDVSLALAYATLGVPIGLYRERDKLIPIIARAPREERTDVASLPDRLVWSQSQQRYIPMRQVVSSFDLTADDAMIFRRDRVRSIQARANAQPGLNTRQAFDAVRPEIEAIELPPGYALDWGGEHEADQRAYDTLLPKILLAYLFMIVITILMFGRVREAIVIWLSVPMTVCGVVLGLLVTDLSFTFPSFFGFLGLSGMLVKNAIVLIAEIDKRLTEGELSIHTLVQGSVSRMRPVLLASGTTIAGMSPLLADPFFLEMAVCIMSGLAFATLLTLVAVPVFYRIALGKRIQDA